MTWCCAASARSAWPASFTTSRPPSHPDFAPLEVLGDDARPGAVGRPVQGAGRDEEGQRRLLLRLAVARSRRLRSDGAGGHESTPEAVRDALIDVMEKLGEAKIDEAEVERAKTKLAQRFERLMSNSQVLARCS